MSIMTLSSTGQLWTTNTCFADGNYQETFKVLVYMVK